MLDQVIAAIRAEQARCAHAAVARGPKGGDVYEFGYACGMYAGLERALQAIDNVLKEDNKQ